MSNPTKRGYRLDSIDLLRGLVIVIMAIDHVRDFFHAGAEQDPMANPNIGLALFLTRWITHFCAPVFVLLAGVSAGLMSARKTPAELSRFLLTRGLWIVFVEVVIISTAFTFSPRGLAPIGGLIFVPLQVLWAIGASMLALAALQWLGRPACLAIGAVIIAAHNLLDPIWPAAALMDSASHPLWVALHAQMSIRFGPALLLFAYPLLPWIGVMALGFGVSRVFELPAPRRNVVLIRTGLALSAAFVCLRATHLYGDPNPWQFQPGGAIATAVDFLNTTKYPPSLLFALMTLGPASIFCGFADRITGPIKNVLVTFGRVPFAFYVAHFYLIHALSVLLGVFQGFRPQQMMTFIFFYPKGYGVGLAGVYAVWALVIVILYPFCRWMAGVKARRRDWWLSYL